MHHLVEVSHKNSEQERDLSMRAKDEYLNQLQDRLLKQQMENDEERTRLQNLLVKMEIQLREQNRKLEEDKWKLNQVCCQGSTNYFVCRLLLVKFWIL